MSKRSPAELQKLPIGELRKTAVSLGVTLRRDMSATEIVAAILQKQDSPAERVQIVMDESSRPAKGWARIEIHKDPSPQASNGDVFVSVNGYSVLIKRGVKVDVPIKILRGSLMTATNSVMRENMAATSPEDRYYFEEVHSYPFTVHDINEGPDPRDTNEKVSEKRNAPRKAFWEKHGYWPKPAELREWMAGGGAK